MEFTHSRSGGTSAARSAVLLATGLSVTGLTMTGTTGAVQAASASAASSDRAPAAERARILERAAITEQWDPVPPVVRPGTGSAPPDDALVLFDGTDTLAWRSASGAAADWRIVNNALEVTPGSGDLVSVALFSDVQLHLEWRSPPQVVGDGQGRGNSGVFLMGRYEVQILDSFANPTYANGQAASVYKQHIPLVNAAREPGRWQSYDILFAAPAFNSAGRVTQPATLTVLHNGIVVQNHVALSGATEFIGAPAYVAHGPGPLRLQDHGNPVQFRNIWVRRL